MFDPPECLVLGAPRFAGHRHVRGLVWPVYFAGRKVIHVKLSFGTINYIFLYVLYKTPLGTAKSRPVRGRR